MAVEVKGGDAIAKNVMAKIKKDKSKLEVGFMNPATATIATYNEFGAHIPVTDRMRAYFRWKFKVNLKKETTHIVIPARPFMQMTVAKNQKQWGIILPKLLKKYDYDVEKAFNALGEVIKGQIQEMMTNGEFVANSPLTVMLKGGRSKPLFDTGKLHNSVEYGITRK